MRGRTLDKAFVILDEGQNTTANQMKMFLTRMGMSAKFIITGAGGPGGNAHGPDEKLHIPTAKKVTKCMSAAVSVAIR